MQAVAFRREIIAVTTKDIARLAGVSVATVSRSLNDSPRISAETKERVKRIAAELDFEFDASARSLSTRRSGTVAFVVPAFLNRFANTLYLDGLIYDIRVGLAARGYDCIVTEADGPDGKSNLKRLVLQRKVDGIILLLETTRPEDWSVIKKKDIPVLHVHYMPSFLSTEGVDYFYTDNVLGGRLATGALLDAGCERIACLIDVCRNPEMADRERGYLDAHVARGLAPDPRLRFVAENSFETALACVKENIGILRSMDGIFVTTDIMAIAVMRGLDEAGIMVPRDCKVVGYDDIELSTYVKPSLTTVHQPREEIARLACERLAYLLEGGKADPPAQRLLAPRLVRRESC